LNISKSGFGSISAGVRGLTVNISRKGARTTLGLPGTGLSYVTRLQRHSISERGWLLVLLVLLLIALMYWFIR
jgi:hypothetical protein